MDRPDEIRFADTAYISWDKFRWLSPLEVGTGKAERKGHSAWSRAHRAWCIGHRAKRGCKPERMDELNVLIEFNVYLRGPGAFIS